MKLFSNDGDVIMKISSLERKGDDLIAKGKMMGTIPATIYIRPSEAWKGVKLLSWSLWIYIPVFLVKAWWQRNR